MSMHDTIAALRASIAMSKRPGNEGQCLHNGKAYRPVNEVLSPALAALELVESLVKDLEGMEAGTNAMLLKGQVQNALDSFKAEFEPNLRNLNAAKAALRR